jgi:NAD(P)-dependent dehydrogenase (short-subunit alcohol dehydrogenase family)
MALTHSQKLAGKVAFVTGAASGLGRAVTLLFAVEGAAVFATDRDEAGLREIAAESVATHPVDVSQSASVHRAVRACVDELGGIDILVTAAGILGKGGAVADCPEEEWDRVFAVNVRGTYLCARHVVPELKKRGGGAIVTFASTAGLVGSPWLGAYSASKGAVVLMTKSMAKSHAADGIRVNAVCPGSIETPMLEATFATAGSREAEQAMRTKFKEIHPLGRFGQAEEVARAVLYLASDDASYVTGVALPVDGGRVA